MTLLQIIARSRYNIIIIIVRESISIYLFDQHTRAFSATRPDRCASVRTVYARTITLLYYYCMRSRNRSSDLYKNHDEYINHNKIVYNTVVSFSLYAVIRFQRRSTSRNTRLRVLGDDSFDASKYRYFSRDTFSVGTTILVSNRLTSTRKHGLIFFFFFNNITIIQEE